MNTFVDRPEFINRDSRIHRPWSWQYTVTADSMTRRHSVFFQHTDLTGKRVLDLGCCCAATGAWVLDRGAAHYTGVELQRKFFATAEQNMAQYYQPEQYRLYNSDIESFLDSHNEQYDIVIMFGVLHCIFDWFKILKKLTSISNEIIIECLHPYNGFKDLFPEAGHDELYSKWEKLSFVQIAAKTGTAGEDRGSWVFDGVGISVGALKNAYGYLGWDLDIDVTRNAVQQLPEIYSLNSPAYCPRYVARATQGQRTIWEFKDNYADPTKTNYEYQPW